MMGSDRSRLQPPSENSSTRKRVQTAVGRKPAAYFARYGWRLPVMRDVELARQPDAHGPPRLPRAERGDGRIRIGLHFLAAERAAHAQTLDRHLIARHAEHARDHLLRFGRMLCRRVDRDESRFVNPRNGGLRLEIEMFLAADGQLAVDTNGARVDGGRVAVDDPKRVGEKAALVDGLFDREDGGQRLVRGRHRAERRVAAASSVSPSTQAIGCW